MSASLFSNSDQRSFTEKEKKGAGVRKPQFSKNTACSSYVQPWLVVAVGGVGGGWWLVADGSSWRLVAVGGWRSLEAVLSWEATWRIRLLFCLFDVWMLVSS